MSKELNSGCEACRKVINVQQEQGWLQDWTLGYPSLYWRNSDLDPPTSTDCLLSPRIVLSRGWASLECCSGKVCEWGNIFEKSMMRTSTWQSLSIASEASSSSPNSCDSQEWPYKSYVALDAECSVAPQNPWWLKRWHVPSLCKWCLWVRQVCNSQPCIFLPS